MSCLTNTNMRIQWHEWQLDDEKWRKPNLKYFSKWIFRKVDVAVMAVKPKTCTNFPEEKKRGLARAPGVIKISSGDEDDKRPCCDNNMNHEL